MSVCTTHRHKYKLTSLSGWFWWKSQRVPTQEVAQGQQNLCTKVFLIQFLWPPFAEHQSTTILNSPTPDHHHTLLSYTKVPEHQSTRSPFAECGAPGVTTRPWLVDMKLQLKMDGGVICKLADIKQQYFFMYVRWVIKKTWKRAKMLTEKNLGRTETFKYVR